ncbi:UTRA domain-containing protein [Fictibacillus terranigra]|uniref:UTRA domain-containing protein n=1 Tax=Fictibacillus terranigra TaxID=3058424 RepID=A0ABT8E547_9BACL|nr:UTRA domain-containing protein [Fictibacillus sp. CENA-BCM004]MDN4073030.1 UTRA domain-containing protein [Fictibacillus sp. CENA-BCM004]
MNDDDVPYILFTHYLTMRMEDAELADLNVESLYDLIEEKGVSLEKFRDEFAVSIAPSDVEDRLTQIKEHLY